MNDEDDGGLISKRKGNDDLSLPKATVQKIITEILSHDQGMAFARETRDLLIECCVEFITLISSEANEIAEKEAKKTIACEHVTSALKSLGYESYVPEILKVAQEHKVQQVVSEAPQLRGGDISGQPLIRVIQGREKKQDKIAQSGMTEEELIRQQEELFRSATNKFTSGQAES